MVRTSMYRIEGVEQVVHFFDRKGDATDLLDVVRDSAKRIGDDWAKAVPVGPDRFRRKKGQEAKKLVPGGRLRASIDSEAHVDSSGRFIGEAYSLAFTSHFFERGTVKMRKQPFASRALDRETPRFVAEVNRAVDR